MLGSCRARNGAPEGIRTPDPQIRSLVLYPAELPARASPRSAIPGAGQAAPAARQGAEAVNVLRQTAWRAGSLSRQDLGHGLTKHIARPLHGAFRFPLPGDPEHAMP